ncbi:MAG: hypothetical protein Q4D14_05205 [Bacteroidales bacterium]|nr:hypothetical protein [Bacteroidales bacterium]
MFEAVMQLALADGELSYIEANNLFIVADALGVGREYVLLMVADMVQEEEIQVNFGEE